MIGWTSSGIERRSTAARMRPLGMALIVAFWVMHFVFLSLARAIQYPSMSGEGLLLPRALTELAAIGLSLAIMEMHARWSGGMVTRLVLTFALAIVGTALHFGANLAFFTWLGPELGNEYSMALPDYAMAVVDWLFIYVGISAILMGLRFHADLVDRDLSLVQLDALARDAELRALRYQLNPHFLFNALNSATALIAQNHAREAEDMIENLCDFLRAGLALDAEDDIPLSREIALQRLYLDVEAVRFPNRLKVVFDVPDELAEVPVPSLLLQPLVENAIRYSVADSMVPVLLTIEASRTRGRLRLIVRDDGGDGGPKPAGSRHGTGVGLANVAARLRARFGENHYFLAGPGPRGGFVVTLELPLRMADVDA